MQISHGRGHQGQAVPLQDGAVRQPLPQPEPDPELLAELPGFPAVPARHGCPRCRCQPVPVVLPRLQIPVPHLLGDSVGRGPGRGDFPRQDLSVPGGRWHR